jgi:hypothetical protein
LAKPEIIDHLEVLRVEGIIKIQNGTAYHIACTIYTFVFHFYAAISILDSLKFVGLSMALIVYLYICSYILHVSTIKYIWI